MLTQYAFMSTKKRMRTLEGAAVLDRLKEELKSRGLIHEEIAKQWGLSRSYVGQVLSGRAMMSGTVLRALVAHNYDIHYILLGERKEESERLRGLEEEIKRANALIESLERILSKK